MKRLKLVPYPINVNGTTTCVIDAFDANGTKVESVKVVLESWPSRTTAAKQLAKLDGSTVDEIHQVLVSIIDQIRPEGSDRGEDIGLKKRLADAIRGRHHFAQDTGGALYIYVDGVYRQLAATKTIKSAILEFLHEWHVTRYWTTDLSPAVAEYIGVYAPILWDTPPTDRINVANGIIDLDTRELIPQTPEYLSPIQIPVTYDPGATCPAWDAFTGQVLPSDAPEFAYEMFADLLTPDRSQQVAILLLGSGANGKSVLLTAIEAALGLANVATLSLQKLESDKFAVARLVGKLANINRDLPATELKGTAVFKQIVGGDRLTGEYKFRDSFDFTPFTRLVFSANHAPRSPDASEGFFRRWIVCPFPNTFERGNAASSADLHRRLTAPAELSGLLNRALDILPRLRARGFTISPMMQLASEEFRALTDPISVFLDSKTIEGQSLRVPKRDLFDAYRVAAAKAGWATIQIQAFGRTLKKLRPSVGQGQLTIKGVEKTECWTGLGLKQDSDEGSTEVPQWID